jgi:hypothetical protein
MNREQEISVNYKKGSELGVKLLAGTFVVNFLIRVQPVIKAKDEMTVL